MKIVVHKSKRGDHYTHIDTDAVENPALSGLAKALHLYIISRPEGWELRMSDIVKRFKESPVTIKKAVNELENEGYLRRDEYHYTDTGRFAKLEYHMYEMPLPQSERTKLNRRRKERSTVV